MTLLTLRELTSGASMRWGATDVAAVKMSLSNNSSYICSSICTKLHRVIFSGGRPLAGLLLRYTIYVFTWVMSSTKPPTHFQQCMRHFAGSAIRACGWCKHFTVFVKRMMKCTEEGPDSRCARRAPGIISRPPVSRRHYEIQNGWQCKLTYYQQHFQPPSVFLGCLEL